MKNKDKIINILKKETCWISVITILNQIENINKTTIYRNLDKLILSWKILAEFSKNWEKLYSIKENHHHHFICDICNKKINIWCTLEDYIKNIESTFNLKINNHSFTLNWICNNCINNNLTKWK